MKIIKSIPTLIALLILLGPIAAFSASHRDQAAALDEPVKARTVRGELLSIDLNDRTAIIGGYEYYFGPHTMPVEVQMLNSGAGAVELLKPGMKVEVVYGELGLSRIVASIKQIPYDTQVEH